ncbi:hypothetical protein [Nonomuraea sp. NPDC050691]|uniref:hypothetical protein n=1 Tax=Nonomuraea sp. NPDC050691 TaxID=3155661 RepID=UPI0033DE509E
MEVFMPLKRTSRTILRLGAVGAVLFMEMSPQESATAVADSFPVMGYIVEVEFVDVRLNSVDDCEELASNCERAEVYGTIFAQSSSGASDLYPSRNLAEWGGSGLPGVCPGTSTPNYYFWWEDNKSCLRGMLEDNTYAFADAYMCPAHTYTSCATNYAKPTNRHRIKVRHGESVKTYIHFRDYDELSSDEDVCRTWQWWGPFTLDQLKTLDTTGTMNSYPNNGAGDCTVNVRLQAVEPFYAIG